MGKRTQPQVELIDLQGIITEGLVTSHKITCKFVIIAGEEELTLIFGPVRQYRYHANLVDAYCRQRDIPAGWLKKPDVVEVYDDSHVIKSGGWMDLEPESQYMKIYGYSTAYGRFDPADLNQIIDGCPDLKRYTIDVSV